MYDFEKFPDDKKSLAKFRTTYNSQKHFQKTQE